MDGSSLLYIEGFFQLVGHLRQGLAKEFRDFDDAPDNRLAAESML